MNQAHLKQYLDIIQELLTCPQGEEWVRLKQHEDRVNPELIQVMEQVAIQLAREGNQEAARFLHNWAAKLHHILVKEVKPLTTEVDRDQEYLSLIQTLLNCSEGDEQRILAEHPDLVGPGLVQKMSEVAQQLQQQGAEAAANYLKDLASELNQAWIKAHAFQPHFQKEIGNPPPKAVAQKLEGTSPEQMPQRPEPENFKVETAAPETTVPPSVITSLQLKINQQVADSLQEIAQALHQLNQALAAHRTIATPAVNPLWYMDILERAYTSQWLMTTEEVEQLIGVKPRCHGDEMTYQRGVWKFVKVGKLGTQTAWQVMKAEVEADLPEPMAAAPQQPSDNGRSKETEFTEAQSHQLMAKDSEDLWA